MYRDYVDRSYQDGPELSGIKLTHQEVFAKQEDHVFFQNIRNKRIFCHLSEPLESTEKLVIMCHGFKGDSTGPARGFVSFSRLLAQHGYSVLRFDQPNCGNSDGPFLDVSFNEWVDTIVALVDKYTEEGYRISLLGESMGASAAIVATSKDRIHGRVSALLLWSPDPVRSFNGDPATVYEERGRKYHGRFWQEAKEADVTGSLQTFEGGIHLVHGKHDDVVGRDMHDLVEVAREMGGTILTLDGEGHSNWHEDTALMVFAQETEKLEVWMS